MLKDVILLDPYPRAVADIFDTETFRRLKEMGDLVIHEGSPMPAALVDRHIENTVLLLGQTDMPKERLQRARKLRAIINVETNLLPNIDYDFCFEHGIHVLTPSKAFAGAVAEAALGMAIDLVRGISMADRQFRGGNEQYGLESNRQSFLFARAPVGLIGYGDLGQELRRLLVPFRNPVKVFDPWLPRHFLEAHDVAPTTLGDLLTTSRVIFVFAGVTAENEGFLDEEALSTITAGSAFLLMSRAAVVDFPALLAQASTGRLKVATDVFPKEPVAADDPMRDNAGMLFSAHRTGGIQAALYEIGRMAVDDGELVLRGLAPVVCRRAQRETVGRLRSKPITKT